VRSASIREVRQFYAKLMAAASKSDDPRLERVFESVPREAFVGPGPWQTYQDGSYFETPSSDPAYLYRNALVALDASKGINNGEPHLHAAWIGAAAPRSGEAVCHIGAGTGYYTAILSMLVFPDGSVHAYEIDAKLAATARETLKPFEGISVIHGDATRLPIPSCDLVYVNAGVAVPPISWLNALKPNARMIFPWRPAERVGLTVIIWRAETLPRPSVRPSEWLAVSASSIRAVASLAAGSSNLATMSPNARSRRRWGARRGSNPSRPMRRAALNAASPWPWGSERRISKPRSPTGTRDSPRRAARKGSIRSTGSLERLARVRFFTLPSWR